MIYLTTLSGTEDCIALNGRMSSEKRIEMDVEGNGLGLI
jgi:hypothetical protein